MLSAWARPVRALGRFLSQGWVAIVVFNVVMIAWHRPPLFDLAQRNQLVHIWLMHSSFFLASLPASQMNYSIQLRYGTEYATNWGLPRSFAFEVCGPPAGTSTVLPAMARGALVEVGSWRR
jgi:hypothetical protein